MFLLCSSPGCPKTQCVAQAGFKHSDPTTLSAAVPGVQSQVYSLTPSQWPFSMSLLCICSFTLSSANILLCQSCFKAMNILRIMRTLIVKGPWTESELAFVGWHSLLWAVGWPRSSVWGRGLLRNKTHREIKHVESCCKGLRRPKILRVSQQGSVLGMLAVWHQPKGKYKMQEVAVLLPTSDHS